MRILLGLMLVSMVLLAGCPGGGPQEAPEQAQEPVQEQQPADTPQEEGTEAGEEQPEEAPPEEEGGTETQEESPFESWDMQAMMALGQPVHCTVTYTSGGISTTSEMWMKEENLRVETSTAAGEDTYSGTVVMKGDEVYTQSTASYAGMAEEECDWIKLDSERLKECIPESMSEEESTFEIDYDEEYEEVPSEYNCDYGTFGDEKFEVSGTVCDLTEDLCDMYAMMEGGTYTGADPSMCEGLEGEDYAQCMEALGLQ
ncbi:hypothetical protein GF415_00310 [Candidatus Micrarchaeota archaeon]|nr:hypothetical protein [Candidatus Micrarchaeota archaeon]